jgi:hypothetical protein
MKKIYLLVFILLTGSSSFSFRPADIDKKLMAAFPSFFPQAKDVNWQESAEAYLVYFNDRGVRVRIEYAKDKSSVQITRYYEQENLPYYIRQILENKYPDKKIFGITEIAKVSQPGNVTDLNYYVILQDEKRWYTVKIDNSGNAAIINKYGKAPVSSKTGTRMIYEDSVPFLIAFSM